MKRVLPAVLVAALAGCAADPINPEYTAPYSMVATEVALTGSALTRGVLLLSVDGKRVSEDRAVIEPGKRKVEVEIVKRSNEPSATASFELDARPCTRYYLAARRPPGPKTSWEPYVVTGDALRPCETRFGVKSEFQPR